MPPIDKTNRSSGVAPLSGQAGGTAIEKKRSNRLAPEPVAQQNVSLSAPASSKLKQLVKHDAFTVAAGKAPKGIKSVPIGLAVVNKTASQTTKTVATAVGAAGNADVKLAGRAMGGVGGGMKALALVQLGAELHDTRRIAKEDRAEFERFKTLMDAYDPETGKVGFELGTHPAWLPEDPTAALADMAKKPGFLDAYVKGEGLSKERVILLKKTLITSAEATSGIASAAAAKWVPFLGTAIEGAKFVDGAVKVQGGITALNNLRGAAKNLEKTFAGRSGTEAPKLKELLQGLGQHIERERLIKGSKDLATTAAAGAAFGAGLAVAVGTAGLGLAITQPALGIGSAAVDIAMSIRDANHKAMLESVRAETTGDAARLYADEGVVDYGAAQNIGLTEKTILHLLAEGTPEEKQAIRTYLGELGISRKRILAITLHAETKPATALSQLQEALYKDRLSSTQSMSWGLVGNSFKSLGKMMGGIFKGWKKEPRTPPATEAADRISLAAPVAGQSGPSVRNLIERDVAAREPLLDFLSRMSAMRDGQELFRAGSTLSEDERSERLTLSASRLDRRMSRA